MEATSLIAVAAALALAPLQFGLINRVKALAAGRCGPPILQGYRDLAKLLRKGAVYGEPTTWVVRAGPTVGLAAVLTAVALVPLGPFPALLSFGGDLVLLVYLFALQRFFMMLAALDTGSAFEGMGASREAFFGTLAEPAFLLAFLAAVRAGGAFSLAGLLGGTAAASPALFLVVAALFLVFLAENARVPVDDPNTHLELTMIHEVMVLDHSGVDLAYITYASALKMWVLAVVLVQLILPSGLVPAWVAAAAVLAATLGISLLTGAVESFTARLRLSRVPRLLVGAGGISALAVMLTIF